MSGLWTSSQRSAHFLGHPPLYHYALLRLNHLCAVDLLAILGSTTCTKMDPTLPLRLSQLTLWLSFMTFRPNAVGSSLGWHFLAGIHSFRTITTERLLVHFVSRVQLLLSLCQNAQSVGYVLAYQMPLLFGDALYANMPTLRQGAWPVAHEQCEILVDIPQLWSYDRSSKSSGQTGSVPWIKLDGSKPANDQLSNS